MKMLIKSIAIVSLISVSSLSADVNKGQKLYVKKLKTECKMNGAVMASKHTETEWEDLLNSNELKKEIKTICPSVSEKSLKDKYIKHYYDFFKEYSSDSGNIPSC
jgi:23S rRNA pseudoU1915 N3-methylase RlmH